MYRITGDSFTVFGDAVGDDAGNFEVVHADVAAAGTDHSIQLVPPVTMTAAHARAARSCSFGAAAQL